MLTTPQSSLSHQAPTPESPGGQRVQHPGQQRSLLGAPTSLLRGNKPQILLLSSPINGAFCPIIAPFRRLARCQTQLRSLAVPSSARHPRKLTTSRPDLPWKLAKRTRASRINECASYRLFTLNVCTNLCRTSRHPGPWYHHHHFCRARPDSQTSDMLPITINIWQG